MAEKGTGYLQSFRQTPGIRHIDALDGIRVLIILIVGWFGFNVMSAQRVDAISGLVAINSLMAMVGGTITANAIGKKNDRICLVFFFLLRPAKMHVKTTNTAVTIR